MKLTPYVVSLLLGVAGSLAPASGAEGPGLVPGRGQVVFAARMFAQGGKQNGTVRVTEGGDGTLSVFVLLANASGSIEPASIDRGTCKRLGPSLHSLTTLSGGHSMSVVPGLSAKQIRSGFFAVAVHASPFGGPVVSCGDIGKRAQPISTTETEGDGEPTVR